MHIQCTKAMIDYIKPTLIMKDTDNDVYAWHAHLVKRHRKNLLVLMHDLSRFTIVFYGLKKTHLKYLNQIINTAVINSMEQSLFTDKQITNYLKKQPKALTFDKTKNRRLVARLNKAIEMTDYILSTDGYYEDNIEQLHASAFCNRLIVCENNYKVCYKPEEKLHEYLEMYLEK